MDLSFLQGRINTNSLEPLIANEVSDDNNEALLKLLSTLSNGETILSKVVAAAEDSVTLRLAGGIEINASKEQNVSVTEGSSVILEVEKHNDNKVLLRPLYQNNRAEETVNAAIKQAYIPFNEKSVELVARKMEYGQPIDKNSLQTSYREVISNPDIPVKYVVDLQKLNIFRTPENLSQYENYMNMENSLVSSFAEIEEAIISELSSDGALALNVQPGESENVTLNAKSFTILLDSLETFSNNLISVPGETNENALADNINKMVSEALSFSDKNVFLNELNKVLQNSEKSLPEAKDLLGATFKAASLVVSENPLLIDDVREIFKSSEFKTLINNVFSERLVINNENDLNSDYKTEIKDMYQRILHNTGNLLNALKTAGIEDPVINNPVQNLSNNIDFMNALNSYVPYVQIPFKGSDGDKNSELYVFKNGKNLSSKDSELSCYVHLDMDNLGPVDVYVTLNNQNVSTNFKVKDEECLLLIENNMELLNKRLSDKGYDFSFDVNVSDNYKTPIEIMMDEMNGKVLISNTTFDARV